MAEEAHTGESAETAADERKGQQGFFADAAGISLCLPLIEAVDEEGHEVDSDEVQPKKRKVAGTGDKNGGGAVGTADDTERKQLQHRGLLVLKCAARRRKGSNASNFLYFSGRQGKSQRNPLSKGENVCIISSFMKYP